MNAGRSRVSAGARVHGSRDTDLRALAELALTAMEGGVMQARTHRDVSHFDRAVDQLRAYFGMLMVKEEESV